MLPVPFGSRFNKLISLFQNMPLISPFVLSRNYSSNFYPVCTIVGSRHGDELITPEIVSNRHKKFMTKVESFFVSFKAHFAAIEKFLVRKGQTTGLFSFVDSRSVCAAEK